MKKVIIPILVLTVAGAGWYFFAGNKKGSPASIGNSLKNEAFKGSMAAAVKLGVPMKCSYSIGENMENEGYIQGKNYRGKSMDPQTSDVVEIMMKDSCMWMWTEGEGDGTTICYEEQEANKMFWEEMSEENIETATENAEASEMEFDCKPTVITPNIFTPPSDVEFTDLSEIMKESMKQMENLNMDPINPEIFTDGFESGDTSNWLE